MKTASRACGHCGSEETEPHCENGRCTWVKCTQCHRLTDTKKPSPHGEG